MDLKTLLGEELMQQVEPKLKEAGYVLVPTSRMAQIKKDAEEAASAQIKTLQDQIDAHVALIENLKEKAQAGENVAKQLEDAQKQAADSRAKYNEDLIQMEKLSEVKLALLAAEAKPHLIKAMLMEMDMSKIVKVNDKFIGIEDQIEQLKNGAFKDDFGKVRLSGSPPEFGSPQDEVNPWIKGKHYSVYQQSILIKTDPAKASKMMKIAGVE